MTPRAAHDKSALVIVSESLRAVLDAQRACLDSQSAFATVTLVSARGSAPQEVGAKLVCTPAELLAGTVGGGRLEAHALVRARALLDARGPACVLETINLQRDIGMTCGGEVTLLYELVGCDPFDVVVFGAGHVAQSVVRLLATLDARVRVIDPRPEWIERVIAAPNVRAERAEDPSASVPSLPERAYVIVMTQGHATDLPVLKAVFAWGRYAYVGVMGSAVKAGKIRRELEASGVDPALVRALRCPIGLPFGANTPAEIAVSVVAEVLSVRDTQNQVGP